MMPSLIDQLRNLLLLASPQSESIEVLFVTDANLKEKVSSFGSVVAFATDTLGLSEDDIRWVKRWSEAEKIIGRFSHIDRLVLLFHGAPGQLMIGILLSVSTLQIPDEPWPSIDEVTIEGCELAADAPAALVFTQKLKTPRLVAWNFSHGFNNDRVGPGANTQKIQGRLDVFSGYTLPGTPDAATIKNEANAKKGNKDPEKRLRFVGREWLREDLSEKDLPLPPASRAKFRKRSEAVSVANRMTITTAEEASAFKAEEEAVPSGRTPRQVIFEPAD
ncbi:MAG: hypothetical protein ACRDHM_04345 [Actinomycetota bacterium]